jgi:hypothetical protein
MVWCKTPSTAHVNIIQGGPKVGIQYIVYNVIITVYLLLAHSVHYVTL